MTESQATINNVHPIPKKISIRERSILVGDIIAVNGYRVNRGVLKQCFAEGGYQAQETPHFLLLTRSELPRTVIVHWFAPQEIDADLGDYVIQELKPLGLLTQPRHFSDAFGALVGSLCPFLARPLTPLRRSTVVCWPCRSAKACLTLAAPLAFCHCWWLSAFPPFRRSWEWIFRVALFQ